ncbi:MAG TPA: cytochrome c oxidase subunit 3 [Candidatus Acidoferrales bacterium]|jgi:cytochrome c oxidase subunit 3|nr:cytochrome c oxidase subunit 3 [Candidatus Acidoferrales bacterium]
MPIAGEHVDIERKPRLGGGGPGKIPHRRGYGGGDDGDHNERGGWPSRREKLRRYRVGMMLCIISVSTLFICLTAVYVMRQSMGRYDPRLREFVSDWRPLHLPYPQLWTNTALLLLSSVTLELARRKMVRDSEFHSLGIQPPHRRGDLPWLGITLFLAFGFLAGQVLVWNKLSLQGLFTRANPSSSFFFVLTGAHAVHLAGGLIALIFAAGGTWMAHRFESRQLIVEVTSWYWHFMGVLWLYIFGLLHFARG